ncbi:hypothetical protein QDX21_04065 [Auritidibacter ignavus]|uniref:Cell division protein FtsL n=1 Tax=Auritidibacter ignavus TaxID=678932 RepID=A0AAJ6AIA0_9MICC|nr:MULTISPECIES: hypothetical protein [Auritidibacter]PXA76385.1 hypothetical protein DCC24_07600 [Auritidibacter sp. NML100628]PXA79612.1 hypothetical protein DCC26_05335 [Auritidibacter sp. NML120779]WGH93981.1 hypothetical protein QDX21_04065 [Auritidibacter ignavus]WHS27724.1 hypothetical protein QM395_10190 [Auritidibacter ignavus]
MSASPQSIRQTASSATADKLPVVNGSSAVKAPLPTTQPKHETATRRRPHLAVVTAPLRATPMGTVIFSVAVLLAALIVVLVINISVSNKQYELLDLNSQTSELREKNEDLEQQVAHLAAPQNLAQKAVDMGMVLPGASASINLDSGKISGTTEAASDDNVPTEFVGSPTVAASEGRQVEVAESQRQAREEPVAVDAKPVPKTLEIDRKVDGPEIGRPSDTSQRSESSANGDAELDETRMSSPQISIP